MSLLSKIGDAIPGLAGGLLGGLVNKDASRDAAGLNRDMQREFAQKGIRWRVEDAKAAGLHPLAALGAAGASFSPSFQAGGLGDSLAQAGQDISRSIDATRTADERRVAEAAQAAAQAERDRSQREVDLSIINRNNSAASLDQASAYEIWNRKAGNPPMPAAGNGLIPGAVVVPRPGRIPIAPDQVTPKAPDMLSIQSGRPGVSAGVNPSSDELATRGGTFYWPGGREGMQENETMQWLLAAYENWPDIDRGLTDWFNNSRARFNEWWKAPFRNLRKYSEDRNRTYFKRGGR